MTISGGTEFVAKQGMMLSQSQMGRGELQELFARASARRAERRRFVDALRRVLNLRASALGMMHAYAAMTGLPEPDQILGDTE